MVDNSTVFEKLERLKAEREALKRYGYEWPALFDAVEWLLEKHKDSRDQ